MEKTGNIDAHTASVLQGLSENMVYLMGFSFVLGSLFTILILIMLDVMRRNATTTAPRKPAPRRRK